LKNVEFCQPSQPSTSSAVDSDQVQWWPPPQPDQTRKTGVGNAPATLLEHPWDHRLSRKQRYANVCLPSRFAFDEDEDEGDTSATSDSQQLSVNQARHRFAAQVPPMDVESRNWRFIGPARRRMGRGGR